MTVLADYRTLIELDQPFQVAAPAASGECPRLVSLLLNELLAERPEAVALAEQMRREGDTERNVLRALLTIRPAEPFLSPAFHAQLDRLLQAERQTRQTIEIGSLSTLAEAFPSTRYGSADVCSLWRGDVTALRVDAVVNAANSALLGCFHPFHPCIDNALHSAAGPRLREDCQRLRELEGHPERTGRAKVTRGYNLPAAFVLHTVGPICCGEGASKAEREALASCYRACLELALEVPAIRSIAFCCVSTGAFGFPQLAAAEIATRTVDRWLVEHPGALDRVAFNVFTDSDLKIYRRLLEAPETKGSRT